VVICWIGSIPIDFWLATSGERVVMSIAVCCAALLPLLVAEAGTQTHFDARELRPVGPPEHRSAEGEPD
jgi:hypothetical protein